LSQDQEDVISGLNAANWQEVVSEFGGKSAEQIKAELDKMFWSDTDTNGDFAQKIHDTIWANS
jgi:hypothetical protein